MRRIHFRLLAFFAVLVSFRTVAAAPALALDATERVYPASQEYLWTFYVPVLTFERHRIIVQALVPAVRSRRLEYEAPALRAERFKVGALAEFRCKYPDWWELSNECGMYWHDLYADLPQLTMQRNHVDYDAAEWDWRERRIDFDVPRWTWKERTLRVMVPVFSSERTPRPEWSRGSGVTLAGESIDRGRAILAATEGDVTKAVGDAVAALDSGIAVAAAEGMDPHRVAMADGPTIDLAQLRSALLDEQARELGRLARIRAELAAAVAGPTDLPAAPR